MRQHWARNDIADGVNAFGAGSEMVINWNGPLFVKLDAHTFKSKMLCVRHSSYRHQHTVACNRFLAFAFHGALSILNARGSYLAAQPELNSLFGKQFFCLRSDLGIDAKKDSLQIFQDGYF